MNMTVRIVFAAWLSITTIPAFADIVVDFEDFPLDGTGYFDGPTANATLETRSYWYGDQDELVGTFNSQGVGFSNSYYQPFNAWSGFAVSNKTDSTTPGFSNQYSAFPGHGANNSTNYAIAFGYLNVKETFFISDPFLFDRTNVNQLRTLPSIYLPPNTQIVSAEVANTTYAGLAMQQGDAPAKMFGGVSGDDPDYLKLSVYGIDSQNQVLSTDIEFFLADYRFADNAQDYILDNWAMLDLSPLAGAASLHFNLQSNDIGDFGMNTPSYFALDNLTITAVPEPSSLALLVGGAATIGIRHRRRGMLLGSIRRFRQKLLHPA